MTKRSFATVLIFLFVALLAAGCGRGKSAPGEGREITVSTAKVEMGRLDRGTMVSGKLEALESANVVSKISGKVAAVNVDVGSLVQAGDVLVTLEANEMAASVAQAEAAANAAGSNREQAQSDYEVARANYERGQALLAQGAISQSDFDNRFALPYRKAEEYYLRGSGAQYSQALAALQLARANYANSIITAPISGVITARNINPGELAGASIPVVTVVNLDKVVVQASVGEDKINELKMGDKVQVKVSAASDRPFEGTITNIALAASSSTKAFPIKIQIDNPNHVLKPGMFAEVPLSRSTAAALTVPREAVVSDGGKNYVWVINDGTVSKKEVSTGVSDGVKIVVTAGLQEGQNVAITGQEDLREGLKVNVR